MDQQKKNGSFQRNYRWRRDEPEEASPAPPLGTLVDAIDLGDLLKPASAFSSSARVTNCELIASYNWLDSAKPSILIPGAPPKWTPLAKPTKLREDNGIYYRDKNAARYPAHPMEPAAQAILTMHPQPLVRQVDIVACGSTMGNLLRFVRGDERPFRMLVEVVGNVVHLVRRENSPKETIPNVRGYGHTFPEAYTTWDTEVRDSASHQRVLRYDFGGLACMVRHEGDGYLLDKLALTLDGSKHQAGIEASSIEELTASLGDNKMSPRTPGASSQLQIQPGGFRVPQSAVFDLKTRSAIRRGRDFLGEELPRMWVSQIPNFVLAYHDRGTFNDIEIMDVSGRVRDWEKSMNKELSQLAVLLQRIVGIARNSQDDRLEVCRQDLKTLDIRVQTPGLSPAFSPDMVVRWGVWLAPNVNSGEDDDTCKDDGSELAWSDGGDDFTACSQDCSYCGRCTY